MRSPSLRAVITLRVCSRAAPMLVPPLNHGGSFMGLRNSGAQRRALGSDVKGTHSKMLSPKTIKPKASPCRRSTNSSTDAMAAS